MPGPPRRYGSAAAKQADYRRRKRAAATDTARLIALQEDTAQAHVVACGKVLQVQKGATDEQRQQQAALKERDMLDALWTLQTLIADFGYGEVYTHVLQHLRETPGNTVCSLTSFPSPSSPPVTSEHRGKRHRHVLHPLPDQTPCP